MKIQLHIKLGNLKYSFLQLNLIIYPNIQPMSNTGLEKFLQTFTMKNKTIYF